jgi:DNA modification methylase
MAIRRSERQFNELTGTEWIRFTRSWFVCNPPRRGASEIEHPAKFPERMVEEFVRFFTRSGEIVLDPFGGVGSTVAAAHQHGRNGVGVEINPAFLALARGRSDIPDDALLLEGDARNARSLLQARGIEQVQMILTSPPYWDMLRKSRGGVLSVQKTRKARGLREFYSDDSRDLGNIADYREFVDALRDIFVGLRSLLAPDRYMVIVCQNVRTPEGIVRPLAWDLTAALSEAYHFKGERIWVQDNKKLGIWGYPTEFVTNVHHHYCLVFKNSAGERRP